MSDLEDAFDIEIEGPRFDFSNLKDATAEMQQYLDDWKAEQEEIAALNQMLEDAIIASLSGATQAITDCIAGIEGADASSVLAALMQPFASTMTSLGEMLIAQGLGIKAFKESLKTLDWKVALAAGTTLLALGAALSSGIKALGSGSSTGATTSAASSSSSAGSSVGGGIETYSQELTVKVVGTLSGSDIILAGEKTQNKWNR